MENQGYIYIFRDCLNCNLIKIGFSIDPIRRVTELHSNTSSHSQMMISQIWKVGDMRYAEKIAHTVMEHHRVNDRREFFEIAPLPYFTPMEQSCYDKTSIYLEYFIELIEEHFGYGNFWYHDVDIEKMYEFYRQGQLLFPEGIKGY